MYKKQGIPFGVLWIAIKHILGSIVMTVIGVIFWTDNNKFYDGRVVAIIAFFAALWTLILAGGFFLRKRFAWKTLNNPWSSHQDYFNSPEIREYFGIEDD